MQNKIQEHCTRELSQALNDNNHDWKVFALANINNENEPVVRNVVLRSFENNRFVCYTDSRSEKIDSIKIKPQVSLCFYSPKLKLQLQVKATAQIHHTDIICKQEWDNSSWTSLLCYHMFEKPCTLLDEPFFYKQNSMTKAEAYENFAVIVCKSIEWDILELKETGNQRTKVIFNEDGSLLSSHFLVP